MEEKKRSKKEEILDTGRVYGSMAKTSPELWEYLEKESLITGRKKHEILQDMVARAIIEREVVARGLTMEQLLAAWDLKDRLEMMLLRKSLEMGTQIFGSLFMQIGQLVGSIREYQEEQMARVVEEEKKRDIEFQMKKTQVQMASALLQAMMPMLINVIRQLQPKGAEVKIPEIKGVEERSVEVEVIE